MKEATEIATDDKHPSFMNTTDATSAFDMSAIHMSPADQTDATLTSDKCTVTTVPLGDQTDVASSLPDCWYMMQYENSQKKYDGLIACNKKLGCDHCAKCDSNSFYSFYDTQIPFMNIKGIRVSPEWANCSVKASEKTTTILQVSQEKNEGAFFIKAHRLCVKQE